MNTRSTTSSSSLGRLVVSSLSICVPLLGFGIYRAHTTSHAEQTLARARGVVISDDLERYSDGDGMVTAYRPVVEFRPLGGDVVRLVEDGTASREYQSGAVVEVIYDPTNPGAGHIHTFWRTWQEAIIGLGGGIVASIGCAIAITLKWRAERRRGLG